MTTAERRVPVILWVFVASTLAMTIALAVWPSALRFIVLHSGPGVGYRLLSYPWAVPGLGAWFWSSGIVVLSGLLITPRVPERHHALLLMLSAVVGGLVFLALSNGQVFAGPGLVAWGYLGAGAGYGLMNWSSLTRRWKLYLVLSLLGLVNGVFTWTLVNRVQSVTAAVVGGTVLLWFAGPD